MPRTIKPPPEAWEGTPDDWKNLSAGDRDRLRVKLAGICPHCRRLPRLADRSLCASCLSGARDRAELAACKKRNRRRAAKRKSRAKQASKRVDR